MRSRVTRVARRVGRRRSDSGVREQPALRLSEVSGFACRAVSRICFPNLLCSVASLHKSGARLGILRNRRCRRRIRGRILVDAVYAANLRSICATTSRMTSA